METERRAGGRILFVMLHLGYVRNYDPTLRLLAARGHEIRVLVLKQRPGKGEDAFGERLVAAYPQVSVDVAPAPSGGHWPTFARGLRLLLDYVRYFDSHFTGAATVRDRAFGYLPHAPHRLFALLGDRGVRLLMQALRRVERALPANAVARAVVASERPDLVLVTPLVDFASPLVDYVKAAQELGVPSGACIASWDNLSNKGDLRVAPDRVFVWNDVQRDEAVTLHGVAPERVVVTGAQLFDHWFGRAPRRGREDFCREAGLDPERPFVLFLGSTAGVAPGEVFFVERWVRSIRASADPRVAELGILLRPHPASFDRYLSLDLTDVENVSMWPPQAAVRSDYYTRSGEDDFFESLHYAAATVGLNTSALIEAAIVGRTVASVDGGRLSGGLDGTLHFAYLADERRGVLRVAPTMERHLADLADIVESGGDDERIRAFVRSFVRPHGLDRPAAPILADALEEAAALDVAPRRATLTDAALRLLLLPLALVVTALSRPRRERETVPVWVRLVGPLVWLWVRLVAHGAFLNRRHWSRAVRRIARAIARRTPGRVRKMLPPPLHVSRWPPPPPFGPHRDPQPPSWVSPRRSAGSDPLRTRAAPAPDAGATGPSAPHVPDAP